MKPTTPSGESITSTSPSSILRKQLRTHETDYLLCIERLPEAIRVVRDWKNEDFPDQKSIDAAAERRDIWLLKIKGYTLLANLCDKIDANPFPGMQLKVTKVAVKLSPEVGRFDWLRIFHLYEIDATWRIYFPAVAVEFDVTELERELLKLAGERDVLPVKETEGVLCWKPTSKTYQSAKSALEGRGWCWKVQKRAGKVSKVICTPKR
jgi:hypothetical protein